MNQRSDLKDKDFVVVVPRIAATCRACHTEIKFKKLETGKSVALEADNNRHRCAQWKSWRLDDG